MAGSMPSSRRTARAGGGDGEEGGLGVDGEAEFVLGALEAQLGDGEAEGIAKEGLGALEDGGRRRGEASTSSRHMPTSWEPLTGEDHRDCLAVDHQVHYLGGDVWAAGGGGEDGRRRAGEARLAAKGSPRRRSPGEGRRTPDEAHDLSQGVRNLMKDQQDQDRGRGRARRVRAWMGCVLAGVMLAAGAGSCARLEGPLSEDPDVMARQVNGGDGGATCAGQAAVFAVRFCDADGAAVAPVGQVGGAGIGWRSRGRWGGRWCCSTWRRGRGRCWWGGRRGSCFLIRDRRSSRSYQNFVNDSYWLLAGLKLRDPGTRRRYAGEMEFGGGGCCRRLELWFDGGVGLTPEDRYWFHIDPETHLPVGWSYVLKGAGGAARRG